jgi:hypothetical protein
LPPEYRPWYVERASGKNARGIEAIIGVSLLLVRVAHATVEIQPLDDVPGGVRESRIVRLLNRVVSEKFEFVTQRDYPWDRTYIVQDLMRGIGRDLIQVETPDRIVEQARDFAIEAKFLCQRVVQQVLGSEGPGQR